MAPLKSPPLLHGIALVSGGAIGAGMFALPMVAAGAGFIWAVAGLLLVWVMTYLASLVLLIVNSSFTPGASFDTLVRARLGANWARANNLAIAFIMMILMYAYTTAGASIIKPLLGSYLDPELLPSSGVLSMLFALLIGLVVWLGTRLVSRLNAILLIAMIITFISANAGLATQIDITLLAMPLGKAITKLGFLWLALPVFVTAFACAGLVPSLVKHYGSDVVKIRQSLFFGTLTSLIIYVVWLSTTLGTLDQTVLEQVILAGGSTGDLISGLQASQLEPQVNAGLSTAKISSTHILKQALGIFSHFAIITSFLSIGLGLFHFIADRFAWSDDPKGKTKTALVAFIPPMLMSFFAPFGFVSAIGYAGLAVVFSFFIVPVLMLKKQRRLTIDHKVKIATTVPNFLLNLLLLFALVIIVLKLATIFALLPSFP